MTWHNIHFPTGGWAIYWTGDPDRGFGKRQPGGWAFNVLPFIEEASLHEMGRGLQGQDRMDAIIQRDATPVSIFNCPTRRPAQPYPNSINFVYNNSGDGEFHARSDYAMNVGDRVDFEHLCFHFSPHSYEDADTRDWGPDKRFFSGVSYCGSLIRIRDIKDGASHTIALGERYINPDHYYDGEGLANNTSMFAGIQDDHYRSTYYEELDGDPVSETRLPHRDESRLELREHFGSAHPSGLHMTMCDGSTRLVSFDVDGNVFSSLGNRLDGR